MSNSVNLSLDVTKTGIQNPLIKVRQGDGGFETLRTTVTANGEPMDLQGWTITFMGTTAGNHKIVDVNITLVEAPNGIFDYTPSKAWGMDIGDFKIAYFKFVKGDGTASSANFRVSVIESVDLTQEEAKDYISVVDASIKEVREHLESSLASVTQSIAATSSTASSLSVQVSSAVNQVNSATSNATSVASSAVDKVNSVASSAVSYISVNDANLVHKTGTETIPGDKTFTGKLTSTQPIDGAISTRNAAFTDFNDVARNMVKYSGSWVVASQSIANSPLQNYYTAIITPGFTGGTDGYIELVPFAGGLSKKYIAVVGSGTLSAWKSFAFDDDVAHKTGNETISGDKTFSGNTTFSNSITAPQVIAADLLTGFHNVIQVPDTTTKIIDLINNDFIKGRGFWKEATFIAFNRVLSDAPTNDAYSIIKLATRGTNRTYVEYSDLSGNVWHTTASSNSINSWVKQANDSDVLHKIGNETIAGDKTFTGNVKFSGDVETQTVTNNGVTMTFKKFGNVVTVIGSGSYTGGDVNAFAKISDGVVPSGYLPAGMALVNANWGANVGQMGFDSSGAWLHRGPSVLSKSWVVITGSWSV